MRLRGFCFDVRAASACNPARFVAQRRRGDLLFARKELQKSVSNMVVKLKGQGTDFAQCKAPATWEGDSFSAAPPGRGALKTHIPNQPSESFQDARSDGRQETLCI